VAIFSLYIHLYIKRDFFCGYILFIYKSRFLYIYRYVCVYIYISIYIFILIYMIKIILHILSRRPIFPTFFSVWGGGGGGGVVADLAECHVSDRPAEGSVSLFSLKPFSQKLHSSMSEHVHSFLELGSFSFSLDFFSPTTMTLRLGICRSEDLILVCSSFVTRGNGGHWRRDAGSMETQVTQLMRSYIWEFWVFKPEMSTWPPLTVGSRGTFTTGSHLVFFVRPQLRVGALTHEAYTSIQPEESPPCGQERECSFHTWSIYFYTTRGVAPGWSVERMQL